MVAQEEIDAVGVKLKVVDAAANLALVVQDAPEKVRLELRLFWEEVELETGRLQRGIAEHFPIHAKSGCAGEQSILHIPGDLIRSCVS